MSIQQFSESEMEELSLRFRGVLEVDNKLRTEGSNQDFQCFQKGND